MTFLDMGKLPEIYIAVSINSFIGTPPFSFVLVWAGFVLQRQKVFAVWTFAENLG